MASQQSKLLRIGIIQDGKIVREKLIKAGESVTVGESPKCTFVFPKTSLEAPEFTLFRATPDGYALHYTRAVRGKVSAGGKVVTLQKALPAEGEGSLGLTQDDRGKLTIDDVTVLFQFVTPPPVAAVKPIQAGDFKPRLFEDDDPAFFGFLGLWTLLAMVFLVYVYNTEPRQYTLDELPDRFVRLVLKPSPSEVEPPEPVESDLKIETPVERPERTEERAPEPEKVSKRSDQEMTVEQAQREQELREGVVQKSKLLAKIIGTTGENSRGVVENMWSDEDQGLGDLDAALRASGGITTDAGEALRSGGEGGKGEAASVGVASVGGGTAEVGGGPSFEAVVSTGKGSLESFTGDRSALAAVVDANMGQLRYCYESRLKVNPNVAGRVEVGWSIEGGKAVGIYLVANSTGDSELADCIMRRLGRWSFPAGSDGDVDGYPFIFAPRK